MAVRKPKKPFLEFEKENPEDYRGKIPPNVEELEAQILGGILIDNEVLNAIIELLTSPEYFYHHAHSLIYQAMIQINGRNEPVDANTVKEELQRMGKLKDAGGVEYLIDLTTNVSSSANSLHYATMVFHKFILRRLISVSGQIVTSCFDPAADPLGVLEEAEQKIMSISELHANKIEFALKDKLDVVIDEIQHRRSNPEDIIGVPTGFTKLDELTSGFQPSELIIIAGRPSHGKTAFALNIARNAAVKHKKCIAFFSLEMAYRELIIRLISSEAMVDGQRLKAGKVSNEEWQRVARTYPNLKTNIYIDDTSEITILELRAKARRMKREYKIDMVIIDYLQLMKGGEYHERRDLEVAYVSRSLKALAKELNIPVVACAQLNRGTEQRGKESRPQLSDLRESGAIEQDADVVMFVHRPIMSLGKKYDENEAEFQELKLDAEVIIGKQRNGPIGRVDLVFKSEYAKFENKLIKPVLNLPVDVNEKGQPF